MGNFDGKVALITGAARGQGRSHAVRLAEEGADIIAIDICDRIATSNHSMGTEDDLRQTVKLVEERDRRIVSFKADVRERNQLTEAVANGVGELGRLDIVSVNAGIASTSQVLDMGEQTWRDMIDVNLTGAWNTATVAIPHIVEGGRGGSVTFTSSAMGLVAVENLGHYTAAKHGILGLMKTFAFELAPHFIRVNAILPTNVDTDMIQNETILKLYMPHLEHPTREDAEQPGSNYVLANALPIPWVESIDISEALLFLSSDAARYITGVALPVDAGFLLKH